MRYREDAILLGLKYNIDDDKIFDLLIEWEDSFDDRLSFEKSPKLKHLIEKLCKKYNINADIVAKILIDYKQMKTKASD